MTLHGMPVYLNVNAGILKPRREHKEPVCPLPTTASVAKKWWKRMTYHKRIQKKWSKRYGMKLVPGMYMIGVPHPAYVIHPAMWRELQLATHPTQEADK